MKSRMGRNPFGGAPEGAPRRASPASRPVRTVRPVGKTTAAPKPRLVDAVNANGRLPSGGLFERAARWLFVELPSESYVLGLKVLLLARGAFTGTVRR